MEQRISFCHGGNTMRYVAIVDPYSSGQFLAAEFLSRGFNCLAIHSHSPLPSAYANSYYPDNFEAEFIAQGEALMPLLTALDDYACAAVVAGTESGVTLANRLAHALGLPSCDPDKIEMLRDKFQMQEQIRRDGLRAIGQLRATSVSQALAQAPSLDSQRIVVKPMSSCGTDGVSFCERPEQLQAAVERVLNQPNCLGQHNDAVLLQAYIDGVEYVVDSVSLDGKHYVTNTSRYQKKAMNGSFVYEQEDFIHPSATHMQGLIDYAMKVLDSLGIRFGAAHMEIMLDRHGPVLIEVGARLHGAKAPRNAQLFANVSQIDLLVDAAIDPQRFALRTQRPPVYHKHSRAVSLINGQRGTVTALPGKEWATTLASYTTAFWNIAEGDLIEPTRGLFDSPGGIFLAHENAEALESDTRLIRKMEQEGKLWTVA
nr:ATP-grasp domain-containing protein [uncultured Pseudomonas sp.]